LCCRANPGGGERWLSWHPLTPYFFPFPPLPPYRRVLIACLSAPRASVCTHSAPSPLLAPLPPSQTVRAAHHKQLGLFWNPLSPTVVGLAWRPSAFSFTPDTALAATTLVRAGAGAGAAGKGKGKGKGKGEGKKRKAGGALGAAAGALALAEDVPAEVPGAAAQVLAVAEDVMALAGGLVVDITL
jgi:hypothetical protein